MQETETFGGWVKRRRKALDMTQQELAEWVGCSLSALIKIEGGLRRPSVQIATRILEYLEVPRVEQAPLLQLARTVRPLAAPAPTNLPASLTSLIGRAAEIAQVRALLAGDARLVTLQGPGGIGKTRLGLAVADALRDAFPDGVFFIALAAIADPTLVPSAITQTLGVRESAGRPLIEVLQDHLRPRQMLLVLDNFEQVATAGPQLTGLLAAAPHLKMLVTSRARLHVYGEQLFSVPPLSLPSAAPGAAAEDLLQFEAVRLFVERARLVQPDFTIAAPGESAPAVAAICRRLDGLPLAIELAAARADQLSPVAMLGRLGDPLDWLKGGPQDLPARQQTLSDAIAWSYNLLEAPAAALFRALAVFVGGCTAEAVAAVYNGEDSQSSTADSAAGLEALVSTSLLQRYGGADGAWRYRMLQTIHEYAAHLLTGSSAEAERLRQRHTHYYLTLAEQAEPELAGAQQASWLARLEDENDNLRAALRSALDTGAAPHALRIAAALWRFWLVRGYYSEGRAHLAAALALAPAGGAATGPPDPALDRLRAKALAGAAVLAWRQADYGPAQRLGAESLALYRAVGDQPGIAQALNALGNVAHRQGDYAAARALFTDSLAVRRTLGDQRAVADSLNNLALVVDDQGDYDLARALYQESLAIRRAVGDHRGVANSLNNLALIAWAHGDYAPAQALLAESLAIYGELGDKRGIANAQNNLGLVAQEEGHYAAARLAPRKPGPLPRLGRQAGHRGQPGWSGAGG